MKDFHADYAVYNGITYREISYFDRLELFGIDDYERKDILFSIPEDSVEDRFSVINHAILNGVDYVFYDITDEIVTYGSTFSGAKYLKEKLCNFDLLFQKIFRGAHKPIEKKIVYVNEKASCPIRIFDYYPEERANGSIMFYESSDRISREDIYKAIDSLYSGRITKKQNDESVHLIDQTIDQVSIDGIWFEIVDDFLYDMIYIAPMKKGSGEKYIFEIVDYFNDNNIK